MACSLHDALTHCFMLKHEILPMLLKSRASCDRELLSLGCKSCIKEIFHFFQLCLLKINIYCCDCGWHYPKPFETIDGLKDKGFLWFHWDRRSSEAIGRTGSKRGLSNASLRTRPSLKSWHRYLRCLNGSSSELNSTFPTGFPSLLYSPIDLYVFVHWCLWCITTADAFATGPLNHAKMVPLCNFAHVRSPFQPQSQPGSPIKSQNCLLYVASILHHDAKNIFSNI